MLYEMKYGNLHINSLFTKLKKMKTNLISN